MSEKIKAFRPFHKYKMNPFQKLINHLFKSGDWREGKFHFSDASSITSLSQKYLSHQKVLLLMHQRRKEFRIGFTFGFSNAEMANQTRDKDSIFNHLN